MRIKKKAGKALSALLTLLMAFSSLNLSVFAVDKNFKVSVQGNGEVEVIDSETINTIENDESSNFYYEPDTQLVLNVKAEQSIEEILINGEPQPLDELSRVTSIDYVVPNDFTSIEVKFSNSPITEDLDEEEEAYIKEIQSIIREQLDVEENQVGYIGDMSDLNLDLPSPYADYRLSVNTSHVFEMDSDSGAFWGDMHIMHLGSYLTFCIDPLTSYLSGDTYYSDGATFSGISNTVRDNIAIGVGICLDQYKATGNLDWYAIAQSYVWDMIGFSRVWATSNSWSTKSAVQGRISWVKTQVTNYKVKPSFNTYTYNIKVGEELRITDTKGVLSNYTVKANGGLTAKISGNTLIVTGTQAQAGKTPTITLERKLNSDAKGNSVCFISYTDRQKMGHFAIQPLTATVKFNVAEATGDLTLTKTSANPDLTDGNDCYSLTGAKYTVYKEQACTNSVGVLTAKADGTTNTLTLDAGTYYIKETTAPKGYALDPDVYKVTVTSGKKTTFETTDLPQGDPIAVLLKKVDADTGDSVPTEKGSLADAQFTFKFYAGEYADNVDPATLGKSPTRTWVMKTDEDGYVDLTESYKVSGDDFYYNGNSDPTLPIGTLTIQETKSPIGYHIDNTVFVRRITSDGNLEAVNTYNMPIVKENAIKFHIVKYETGTTNPVKDVEFVHTNPDGTTETLKTDSNGRIDLEGLAAGKHTIKESRTTDGLIVAPNTFTFEISANGSISNFKSSIQNNLFKYSVDEKGDGNLEVYNSTAPFGIKANKSNNKGTPLSGAEFTLYSDMNCTNVIQKVHTGDNGIAEFDGLDVNTTYYLRETKAPDGYRLPVDVNGRPITYTIRVTEFSPAQNIFNFVVNGKNYTIDSTTGSIRLDGTKSDLNITFDIVNEVHVQLPATGSAMGLFVMAIAIIGLVGYEVKKSKSTSRKDKESDDSESSH